MNLRKLTHRCPKISVAIQELPPHMSYKWVLPGETFCGEKTLPKVDFNIQYLLRNKAAIFYLVIWWFKIFKMGNEDPVFKTFLMLPWTRRRKSRCVPIIWVDMLLLVSLSGLNTRTPLFPTYVHKQCHCAFAF